MNFSKKERILDFNRKSNFVYTAIAPLLSKIEGSHVKPWNFGLCENGDFCGILKTESIGENELKKLAEVSEKNGFSLYIATNNNCYIVKGTNVTPVDFEEGKEFINKQITKFRMSLISL